MNEEKPKALMLWIPAKLHRAFKKRLAGQGRTTKAVVISFLEAYLGKNTEKSPSDSGSASKS
jgi:hypothetical protein